MIWTAKRLASSFVLGGIGGALLDQIHVQTGTLFYPGGGVFFGQPWWVGPNFGFGLLLIVTGAKQFVRGERDTTALRFAVGGALFVLAYLASGIWHQHPRVLAVVLLAAWLPRVLLRQDRGRAIAFSILLGLGGVAYESALSALSLFAYDGVPGLGLVPIWLPALYAHGAPVAVDVAHALGAKRN